MSNRIQLKDVSDRELLELILTNQIVMQSQVERMFEFFRAQEPGSEALNSFRHYHEIYDDFVRRGEDVKRLLLHH